MDSTWKTRKFILTLLSLGATFGALFAGKLSGSEVVALVPLLMGIFTGGNVWSKYAPQSGETKVGDINTPS